MSLRRCVIVLCLFGLGCSRSNVPIGNGTSHDGGGLPPGVGTVCNATSCSGQAPECCTPDNGRTGFCEAVGGSCTNSTYTCDGPEDCVSDEGTDMSLAFVCCIEQSVGNAHSRCGVPGSCDADAVACHTNADCSAAAPICCAITGGPYAVCQVTCTS